MPVHRRFPYQNAFPEARARTPVKKDVPVPPGVILAELIVEPPALLDLDNQSNVQVGNRSRAVPSLNLGRKSAGCRSIGGVGSAGSRTCRSAAILSDGKPDSGSRGLSVDVPCGCRCGAGPGTGV